MSDSINPNIIKTIDSLIQSLPYKVGDTVRCYYPEVSEPPRDLKIESLQISSNCTTGVRMKLAGVKATGGCPLWIDSFWVEPIGEEPLEVETKEESKAMEIKWIPVDAENLPEGEVLAIDSEGRTTVGYPEQRPYGKFGLVIVDDKGREMEEVHSFIPMKHLTKVWKKQNLLDGFSKDSEAYSILERALENTTFFNILKETSSGATSTINFFAREMLNQFNGSSDLFEELVYWIKYYLNILF